MIVQYIHNCATYGTMYATSRYRTFMAEKTNAVVVILTPPPVAHNKSLKLYEVAANVDSAAYAWQLELLAQTQKLPMVRTGAVLGNSSYDLQDIYADNMHISDRGHETLAVALDRLVAGE